MTTEYSGAPFGSNCGRFPPGNLSVTGTSERLGPGYYDANCGDFTDSAIARRSSGPGWARAYETAHMLALPYLLNREEWEKQQEMKRKLGPGSYNYKDSLDTPPEKAFTRGLLDMRESRFRDSKITVTPGPGTYGKGGIPHSILEESALKSYSTIGMLDSGGNGLRSLPLTGSHLGPGTYNITSSIDDTVKKQVGLRGPYEVFTADRGKPINTGHFAQSVTYNLAPGQYNFKSMTDDMTGNCKQKHGEFGKAAQYPPRPIDRILASTLALRPRAPSEPGPGQYDPADPNTKHNSFGTKAPPFLSSSQRSDKMATKFFTGNFNPVGPGRYDVKKLDDAQDVNGFQSVFRSKTDRPSGQRLKVLQERLQAKNIPVHNRLFLVPAGEPRRSFDCGRSSIPVA